VLGACPREGVSPAFLLMYGRIWVEEGRGSLGLCGVLPWLQWGIQRSGRTDPREARLARMIVWSSAKDAKEWGIDRPSANVRPVMWGMAWRKPIYTGGEQGGIGG